MLDDRNGDDRNVPHNQNGERRVDSLPTLVGAGRGAIQHEAENHRNHQQLSDKQANQRPKRRKEVIDGRIRFRTTGAKSDQRGSQIKHLERNEPLDPAPVHRQCGCVHHAFMVPYPVLSCQGVSSKYFNPVCERRSTKTAKLRPK